jgi:hypothetical protein
MEGKTTSVDESAMQGTDSLASQAPLPAGGWRIMLCRGGEPVGAGLPARSETFTADARKTLRDEFAMAALTGLVSGRAGSHPSDQANYAKRAYEIADAMLKARSSPPETA